MTSRWWAPPPHSSLRRGSAGKPPALNVRVSSYPPWRHLRQGCGRIDDPVVAPQDTAGEGYVTLTSEPEAERAADAVRGGVRRCRECVHQPPAAIVAGQLEQ